jgi:hypothetical protein
VDKSFAFVSQKQKPTAKTKRSLRRTNVGGNQENKGGDQEKKGPCVGAKEKGRYKCLAPFFTVQT